ncbi:MAG: hypothetical protein UR85_C0004G0082 [Candidatus Nomurabacteria bacterium GW2011_GWF2_35_66]|uniref:Uncharacterized protein n=1 Tax=Candidatus Nomurabacteria bacterium GW2011_GWE1_35_16 TaxID=1618761 RepID=A0A0G0EHS9_9BACT|nr:MAG: hypothetical protein UR55_C0002G0081 [Candidatus Nomurabacteria bacterium GW2011_GWF1_34_20]KKP63660.1 MAG: hypothetical protein UR57_C0002G0081 [Candidatus Nomurabacteria bacterium GW2011_GWE2_34_25]KKP66862.1 MAG: hypothetical protein UR64_C0002G0078 [Candidatus Nomurabacteria bacterium GW2011_GWE1_35_16]KKP83488.1 MAG: hypothetical protein UR85_C0004G0082 [Candidatus Nomurabacteria bacterium GW2011_GWF2_35_66]
MSGLLALTLGLGVSGTAFAYQGDYTKKGPNYSQEFESDMTRVMTNNDYEGWKNLVKNKVGRVDEVITKDNFSKFALAWSLAKEGKIKEANIIRKELGLRTSDGARNANGMGRGMGRGHGMGNRAGFHQVNS